ncbi:MAG: SGNH/GDSL hydrolase family protein [Clostridia bacterium]|nr:SGNH/GDSL hydrolase family protein [Clostridia bacterium]
MKKIKILFQGDSITDAGRDKRNYHHMGMGYPKFAAALIEAAYPDVEIEFINFGISGNRTSELFDRLYSDCIAFQPDVVSILIGVNDVWHRYGGNKIATTDEQIALNYKCILERLKKETNAKILMLQPYTEGEKQAHMRTDVEKVKLIVNDLAEKYADAYVKTDDLMHADENYGKPDYFTPDGVHPNPTGAAFIAKHYLEAISPLIDEILAN